MTPEQNVALERVVITCDCGTEFYVPDALMPKPGREVGQVTCPSCLAKYDFHRNTCGFWQRDYHDFEDDEIEDEE